MEVLVKKSGWITAPDENNDDLYDNNLFCRWHVKGQRDERIEFEVMFVKLQNNPACMDHLQVNVGFDGSKLGRFHGLIGHISFLVNMKIH